jgi:hypothetical protein
MTPAPIPTECPRCGKVLYPIWATRPEPRLSLMGKFGFLIAGLSCTGVYLVAFALLRMATQRYIPMPTQIAAPLALVPALVVGVGIGLVVNQLPRVVKLRCARCHWGATLAVPQSVGRGRLIVKRSAPTMTEVGAARAMPQPDLNRVANETLIDNSPFDQIADDQGKHAEVGAWIYAEFVSGRSFDEIFGEMIAGGWGREEAEALVEEGRKATRDRRP